MVSALALGCGANGAPPRVEESQRAESLYGEDADTPGAIFNVTLERGEHAGSYELASYDPEPCQIGMLGVDLFTVNGSDQPPSLRYAEIRIPDFPNGSGETEIFGFAAKTGDFDLWIDTTADSIRPGGTGAAKWHDDGANDIFIKIQGVANDGTQVTATVKCKRVGR